MCILFPQVIHLSLLASDSESEHRMKAFILFWVFHLLQFINYFMAKKYFLLESFLLLFKFLINLIEILDLPLHVYVNASYFQILSVFKKFLAQVAGVFFLYLFVLNSICLSLSHLKLQLVHIYLRYCNYKFRSSNDYLTRRRSCLLLVMMVCSW